MNKLLLVMLCLFSCLGGYALPLGDPLQSVLLRDGIFSRSRSWEKWNQRLPNFVLSVGYYSDFVFNRRLKADPCCFNQYGAIDAPLGLQEVRSPDISYSIGVFGPYPSYSGAKKIKQMSVYTHAVALSCQILSGLSIFTRLGASNLSMHGYNLGLGLPVSKISDKVKTTNDGRYPLVAIPETPNQLPLSSVYCDPGFSWNIGAHVTLLQRQCTSGSMHAQYFRNRSDINYLNSRIFLRNAVDNFIVWPVNSILPVAYLRNTALSYQEMQIGFGLSHHMSYITAYSGFKFSWVKLAFVGSREALNPEVVNPAHKTFVFPSPEGNLWSARNFNAFSVVSYRPDIPPVDRHDRYNFPELGSFKTKLVKGVLTNRIIGGCVIGISFAHDGAFMVTVETRFPDESALHIHGQLRF